MRVLGAGLAVVALLAAQAPERKTIPQVGLYNDFAGPKSERMTTHVLAIGGSEAELAAARREQRTYEADHSIGDPAGVSFVAINNNGVFDIGDHAPMIPRTRLAASVPLSATLRILRGDAQVAEASGYEIQFAPTEAGSYRLEASAADGRVWIRTAALHLEKVEGRGVARAPPGAAPAAGGEGGNSLPGGEEAGGDKEQPDPDPPEGG